MVFPFAISPYFIAWIENVMYKIVTCNFCSYTMYFHTALKVYEAKLSNAISTAPFLVINLESIYMRSHYA